MAKKKTYSAVPIPPPDGQPLKSLNTLTFWPGAPGSIKAELERRNTDRPLDLYTLFGVLQRIDTTDSKKGEAHTLRGLFAGSRGNLFLPMFRARKLYPPDQVLDMLKEAWEKHRAPVMFAMQLRAAPNTAGRGFTYAVECRVLEPFDQINLLSQSLRGHHVAPAALA